MEKAPRKVEPLALTPEEVADALSVSRHTIYRLIERGNSPTVRIGRLHRVRKVDLERWIEEHLNSAS
jgi:excisionase family DNA binding protein